MPLHSPTNVPERILVFGREKTGKTTGWLEIAKMLQASGSDSRVYVGDSDNAVDRMQIGKFNGLTNLVVKGLDTWADYRGFAELVAKIARPQDWVVVDFVGTAWTVVQDFFVAEVFDQNIGDFFLAARKQLSKDDKNLGALEGWKDYGVINPIYRTQFIDPLIKGRFHLYCTAQADQLSSDRNPTEDVGTRQLLSRWNVKPVGQKTLPFQFHTLLLSGRDGQGRFILNTIGDREREELRGVVVSNFVMDYLVKIAGWQLA